MTFFLHRMTPFSTSVPAPNDPFFQNFNGKFQISRAHCAHFKIFVQISAEKGELCSNLTKFTPNDPLFWEVYTKEGKIFWIPPPMTLFFPTKSYTKFPLFSFSRRQIPVTFVLECPRVSSLEYRVRRIDLFISTLWLYAMNSELSQQDMVSFMAVYRARGV